MLEGKITMKKIFSIALVSGLFCLANPTYAQDTAGKSSTRIGMSIDSLAKLPSFNLETGELNNLSSFNSLQSKNDTANFSLAPIQYNSSQIQYPLFNKGNFQTGIEFNLRQASQLTPQSYHQADLNKNLRSRAYMRYQFTPNYSLTSGIEYDKEAQTQFRLSLSAKAGFQIKKSHHWVSLFKVNWSNRANRTDDFWNQNRLFGEPNYGRLAESGHFTQVSLGTQWQWNINSNLSLTTGANVKHMLGNKQNLFLQNRTPVTVFSAIQYRF
jgi:hypothetical protein